MEQENNLLLFYAWEIKYLEFILLKKIALYYYLINSYYHQVWTFFGQLKLYSFVELHVLILCLLSDSSCMLLLAANTVYTYIRLYHTVCTYVSAERP